MGHTATGIISAPVSFADVNAVLGTSHTDLATLCMENLINMWSGRKPIYNTKWGILNTDDWNGVNRTLAGFKTGGGIKKAALSWDEYITGMNTSTGSVVSKIWEYDKPVADGSCKFRLADFSGYYHNVGRVFNMGTLFGNISNILIPSADGETGRTVAFTFYFTNPTPDGGIAAAQLFGDCWTYYPCIILTNGSTGSNSYQYAVTAPSPISAYAGTSMTITFDTADFAAAIASDFRSLHSGDPYANYPLRTGDKWTACLVLLSQQLTSGIHKIPSSATIIRLEYSSNVDRRTLPIKQTKYINIEWMKMRVTITKIAGYQRKYKIDSIVVTANILSTASMTFTVDAALSTPQGTVNVVGVASGQSINVTGYSSVVFSGSTGEISKTLGITETTYDNTATSAGNQLVNGTLTFRGSEGNFSGGFSIDVSGQSYQYTQEVNLL
jgi:hypothetical protein